MNRVSISKKQNTVNTRSVAVMFLLIPAMALAQQTQKENETPKEAAIEEVILVGYTKVSKADVTNSIATVKADQIKDMPVNSAAEAIQGRMAGVQVLAGEGTPGVEPDIKIRGGNSITQSNAPLYIVDGVQMDNALSVISPQEIESIEVLKDASSTSIYGARGGNGVVLITTKSGKKNRATQITFSTYTGVRNITKTIDVLDPYDFVMYQYQLYNLSQDSNLMSNFVEKYGTYDQLDKYKSITKRDWQKEVFGRTAFNFTNNLNITGGSSTSSFNISLNNVKEDGIMLNSGYKRSMANIKYNFDISKALKMSLNARYSNRTIDGAGTSDTGTNSVNRLRNFVRYMPFDSNYDDFDDFDGYDINSNLVQPIVLANNEIKQDNTKDLLLNTTITYKINNNLEFRSTVGYLNTTRNINQYWGPMTYDGRRYGEMAVVQLRDTKTERITNTNILNYTKKFGKKSKLDVLFGHEMVKTDATSTNIYVKWLPNYLTPQEAFANIQLATPTAGGIQEAPSRNVLPDRLLSFFTRANYIHQNKYILTLSYRADGSSIFGEENKWAYFPSASLAWKVGEEEFLKEKTWINDLKIRAGYGTAGNNRIPAFLYENFFTSSSNFGYAYGANVTPGSSIGTILPNTKIKWETTISKDLGIDFSFLRGKIYGSINGYITDTKDLLLLAQIPKTTGYETQYQNSGKSQNKGIELTIGSNIIENKNFSWRMDLNLSKNNNVIKSLGTNGQEALDYYYTTSGWFNGLEDFLVQVGKPVGTYFGYITEGRYELSDFNYNPVTQVYTLKEGVPDGSAVSNGSKAIQPGDLKLRDINGDGQITPDDRTDLGSSQPKFFGGFNQTFRYKNWDMSMFFNFSVGNKVYNANKIEFTTFYNNYRDNNMVADVANRWQWFDNAGNLVKDPDALAALNQNTTFWTPPSGAPILHSYGIEDGSYLRLSNVTLGYTLPADALQSVFVKSLRIYFTMNNIFTWTKYTGFDPDASTRKNPLTPGVDYSAYPRSRFILTGFDITF